MAVNTSAPATMVARHPLADARHTRDWSQETLALLLKRRGLDTTRKTVTRWERGVVPDAVAQRALAEVFGVPSEVRSQVPWPSWLPSGLVAGIGQPWDEKGTIEALAEVAERAFVDRREFLALVGPELLLPVYTWRLNPGPWLVYRAHGQRVSPALVDELERLVSVRRHMDDEHGGRRLLGMLHADLRFVTEMLRHGSYQEPVGRRLHATAAEISRLAGWAAFDSGRHAAAQQYYLAGLRAAAAAGDHALAVNIVGFMGAQAYSTGRLADSVQLMEVATAESRKAPAIVQAMSWSNSGRVYAKAGQHAAARAALDRSSRLLGQAVTGDTPPWAYWVDQAQLTAQVGRALFDMDDHDAAARNLSAAVAACGAKYPRDRATWQGRAAISQLRMGQVEEACQTGRDAVDLLADQVDSDRGLGFVRMLSKELTPFADSRTGRDFLQYAHSRLGA